MRSFFTCVSEVALLLSLILCADCAIEKRTCYQCEVRDLSLCTDEYLQECPDNQAYDSCLTRISKTKDDGVWIHKSCALGPCSLRDQSQTTGLGLDLCDRSQAEYDCITCCKEDGCNTGGVDTFRSHVVVLIGVFLIKFILERKMKI